MVIYEVNLTIAAAIQQEFLAWFPGHIEKILCFAGFKTAKLLTEASDTDATKVTVQYEIESLPQLNQYLIEHSPRMRQEVIDKFADQFSATRRTLLVAQEFSA